MTQEEIELLFIDLCGRLKYEPYINYNNKIYRLYICYLEDLSNKVKKHEFSRGYDIRNLIIKPYLRPMSSMTKEEEKEVIILWNEDFVDKRSIYHCYPKTTNFYNKHHLDYRGLIEKGLALEAPERMYN